MFLFAAARRPGVLICWLVLLCAAAPALAQQDPGDSGVLPVSQAYQLHGAIARPGELKLHWTIAPDYYLYRGRMKFSAGEGVTLGEPQLPDGERHRDEYLGEVETYHHAIDATLPYTVAPGTRRLQVSVQYQGCHEVDPKICYPPHTQKLDLPLPASTVPVTGSDAPGGSEKESDPGASNHAPDAMPGSPWSALGQSASPGSAAAGMDAAPLPAEQAFAFEALAFSPHRLLLRWTMPKGYYLYRDQTSLQLVDSPELTLGQPAWPAGSAHHDEHYGDVTVFFDQIDVPVPLKGQASARPIELQATFQGCQLGGICYPKMTRSVTIDLGGGLAKGEVTAAPGKVAGDPLSAPPKTSLLLALLLALVGGLVLNLMPCVLPVLSIKAVSLLESGESPSRARRHALFYTAGVLCSFALIGGLIVALRATGHALGWGVQLQQPLVVGVLACVMFAVGLSMSGVVQFGASLGNAGAGLASRAGPAGDFFTGVLAVVVASPCTAPFMGSALIFAFAAPLLASVLVFLALGVGLALPFLLIGFVPGLSRLLPRPGRWMQTLKQVLAFPMYLTAVWLAWVLANQRGPDAVGLLLVAIVLLGMTLWWFERSRYQGAPSRALVLLLAVLTVAPLYLLAQLPAPTQQADAQAGVVAYSAEKLASLRTEGTPVFVDMTADWCVTCKANEHAVLDTKAFRDLLERTGAVYMKGDWTDANPAIAAFLQRWHSPGVPLYVVFPKNGGEGRQLSTVLTRSRVEQALNWAVE